jgi:hypothetical protein
LHRQEGSKDIDHRTFPCAVWPKKRENLPFADCKTDVIDCLYLAEKILKVIYIYDIVYQNIVSQNQYLICLFP